jgi:RNA polymerase subunit RPABC4/transcription elongation factor Spt4
MSDEVSRYSFRRKIGEPIDVPKNQFGQAVIGGQEQEPQQDVEVVFDTQQGIKAQMSILNMAPRVLENMRDALPEDDPQRDIITEQINALIDISVEEQVDEEPVVYEKSKESIAHEGLGDYSNHDAFIQKIMDIDDGGEEASEGDNVLLAKIKIGSTGNISHTDSSNKNCVKCRVSIQQTVKFCPECGASQVVKFCSQCGFNFIDSEKFCPECGTQR